MLTLEKANVVQWCRHVLTRNGDDVLQRALVFEIENRLGEDN